MHDSSPVSAAGSASLWPSSSGEPGSAAVIDTPDEFVPPTRDRALAACSPHLLDTSAVAVHVAVSQSSGGVFAAASAALTPESCAGSGPQLTEAHTQAALHAALCAMQAGAHSSGALICPAL